MFTVAIHQLIGCPLQCQPMMIVMQREVTGYGIIARNLKEKVSSMNSEWQCHVLGPYRLNKNIVFAVDQLRSSVLMERFDVFPRRVRRRACRWIRSLRFFHCSSMVPLRLDMRGCHSIEKKRERRVSRYIHVQARPQRRGVCIVCVHHHRDWIDLGSLVAVHAMTLHELVCMRICPEMVGCFHSGKFKSTWTH